jgi:hypothetical protein
VAGGSAVDDIVKRERERETDRRRETVHLRGVEMGGKMRDTNTARAEKEVRERCVGSSCVRM